MKKFKLTISVGRKLVYQSIISFTNEQEQGCLEKLPLEDEHLLKSELEYAVSDNIGKRRYDKEFETWYKMTLKEYKENYPEIVICAVIQRDVMENLDFSELEFPLYGATEKMIVSAIGNYDVKCIYLKD